MTNRDKLIEDMARALYDNLWGAGYFDKLSQDDRERIKFIHRATAVLTTLEDTYAVVPREPTREMVDSAMTAGYELSRA